MSSQSFEREIPPDPHSARTVLLEVFFADPVLVRDMLQGELRFSPVGREAQVHPARAAHDLPRQIQGFRALAARDRATGVALQLIPTSELQVTLDGEKPTGQPLRRRDGVPQVIDRGVVSADRHRDERWLAQVLAVLHSAKLNSEYLSHVPPPVINNWRYV